MAAPSRTSASRVTDASSTPQPVRFRFGLRSLLLVMAAVGVLSGLARSLVQGDPALAILFKSLAVFCYGGIIAIPGYAFVAALLTLSTKTTWGQRAAEIFAALISAGIWIGFVVAMLGKWPLICAVFSTIIIAVIGWLVRLGWNPPEGPSPESSLRRLLDAKHNCDHKVSGTN